MQIGDKVNVDLDYTKTTGTVVGFYKYCSDLRIQLENGVIVGLPKRKLSPIW